LDSFKQTSVQSVAKLMRSPEMILLLKQIEELLENPSNMQSQEDRGPDTREADHAEYKLIVECNEVTGDISMEVGDIHKFIRDRYSKKFPELDSLVPNPLDYARVVQAMRNEMEMANINLGGILPSATIMVVSVTGSTTNGTALEEEDMETTLEACDEMLKLEAARLRILEFVESRMQQIAPNLSAVVGASVASRMMGAVGGLAYLCKLTANAILGLGSQKKALSGMSSKNVDSQAFLETSDIFNSSPPNIRVKVLRLLAGKATLAARVDNSRTDPAGVAGQQFRDQCHATIEKWLEPPPPKTVKSLAAPDPSERKSRGGKRMRKIKERYKTSDLRAQANRLSFNAVEEGIYTGNTIAAEMEDGMGMAGTASGGGVGRVRLSEAEEKHVKAAGARAIKRQKLKDGGGSASVLGSGSIVPGKSSSVIPGRSSSIIPGRSSSIIPGRSSSIIPGRSSSIIPGRGSIIPGRSTAGRTGTNTAGAHTSGLSSSLAFTPIQGIELSNPNAAKEQGSRAKAEKSYFSNVVGFKRTKKGD